MKYRILALIVCFAFTPLVFGNAFVEYGGHLYSKTSSGTWAQAEAEAVSLGGHLVSINDADEQAFVNGLLSGSTWIGFTDEGTSVWAWISGDAVTYTNWSTYEPNGGTNENCGVSEQAWGGLWNDLPCDRIHAGIVEIDPVPTMACVGFHAPMANYPVTVKKIRALPLKAEIFDIDGFAMIAGDLVAPPIVQVWFDSVDSEEAIDVTDDVLAVGLGDEGNQFVFTESGLWQFNLLTRNYTAPGTYTVLMASGDEYEYVLEPACLTEFVIE
jgi:hypothetical protein